LWSSEKKTTAAVIFIYATFFFIFGILSGAKKIVATAAHKFRVLIESLRNMGGESGDFASLAAFVEHFVGCHKNRLFLIYGLPYITK